MNWKSWCIVFQSTQTSTNNLSRQYNMSITCTRLTYSNDLRGWKGQRNRKYGTWNTTVTLDTKATQPVNNDQSAPPSNLVVLIRQHGSKIRVLKHIISGIDRVEQTQSKSCSELTSATLSIHWDELRQSHDNMWQFSSDPKALGYGEMNSFNIEERV